MISASGSNPLERCSKCTLILRVIQLMNDPGPEALADPTLIMLREPHLGGAGGYVCVVGGEGSGAVAPAVAVAPVAAAAQESATGVQLARLGSGGDIIGRNLEAKYEGRANGCHHFRTFSADRSLERE